ncbi:MAG TPA: pseudouridine-5'-phosphate glycosidase [Gemmatimonadota bacterium]|nr:pseudouridine-5'-phosphate glycosidase [Gemmatimonadota bacterium]
MSAERRSGRPRVALESAFLTTGLPEDVRIETAASMAAAVRKRGAEPAFVGVVHGKPVVGIDENALGELAASARKLSTRDLPIAAARGESGGTTVAATLFLAHREGVEVAATGGIGGVHPGGARLDESADLAELGRTPITLVCSGAKAILDLPATLERLDTLGVTVLGYGTDELPAFWSSESGMTLPERVADAAEAAAVAREARALGLRGAVLVCVPPPADSALPRGESDPAVARALEEARALGMAGAALTPFLLGRIAEITDGRSLRANVALLENNAAVAAEIAVAAAG